MNSRNLPSFDVRELNGSELEHITGGTVICVTIGTKSVCDSDGTYECDDPPGKCFGID